MKRGPCRWDFAEDIVVRSYPELSGRPQGHHGCPWVEKVGEPEIHREEERLKVQPPQTALVQPQAKECRQLWEWFFLRVPGETTTV